MHGISLTFTTPSVDQVVNAGHSLQVTGNAFGVGISSGAGGRATDPVDITSVSVRLQQSTPITATLTRVPTEPKAAPHYHFAATLALPNGTQLLEIFATVSGDDNTSVTVRIRVFAAPKESAGPTTTATLSVAVSNPGPPADGDWASALVAADQTPFTLADAAQWPLFAAVKAVRGQQWPVCRREWLQVLPPDSNISRSQQFAMQDYDLNTVGFSGWVLAPEMSGDDVPFTHPFGNDWECQVALDPNYVGLLSLANRVPNDPKDRDSEVRESLFQAAQLKVPIPPQGLLGVETDGGCVPWNFKHPQMKYYVRPGDRVAAWGRWIVDSGHQVSDKDAGTSSYRTELHPPLLMVTGGTRNPEKGGILTRVLLTSRPYLVMQVFTGTEHIQDDSYGNDGAFLQHIINEVVKVQETASWTLEAHPKVAERPFQGVHLMKFSVGAPPKHSPDQALELQVSFQITHRSGVGVQVVGHGTDVDVYVSMNGSNYAPPPLPLRSEYYVDKQQMGKDSDLLTAEQFAGPLLTVGNPANLEQALARGVRTDRYEIPEINLMNRERALPFTSVNHIPASGGIVLDDGQPYPVFGFLELRWQLPIVTK